MLVPAIGVVSHPEPASEMADCLMRLDHADGDTQLVAKLAAQAGGPVTVDWHWQTATDPTWAACYHNEWTLLLVGGCQTYQHAALTTGGYLLPTIQTVPLAGTFHHYYDRLATQIVNVISGQPRIRNQPFRIAGHSLGGCVAQSVAHKLVTQQVIGANTEICTFGSPKWAWPWQQRELAHIVKARWMNSDDPVPLVYPTVTEYLPFLLSYSLAQAAAIAEYTQGSGGLILSPGGLVHAGGYPTVTNVQWAIGMGSWLWGYEQQPATNPHSLAQYRTRLLAYLARSVPPGQQPRGTLRDEPTEEHNRRTLTRDEAAVVRRLANAEAAQRDIPMRVPRERLVHAERRGGVWAVVWNGEVITVLVRRRSAHSVARSCNDFLHHLLNAGLVQPDTIVEQLRNFLGAAQDATSGITPTLHTELPADIA